MEPRSRRGGTLTNGAGTSGAANAGSVFPARTTKELVAARRVSGARNRTQTDVDAIFELRCVFRDFA
jgi:hypothetical protein